jgi:hypothetical protein
VEWLDGSGGLDWRLKGCDLEDWTGESRDGTLMTGGLEFPTYEGRLTSKTKIAEEREVLEREAYIVESMEGSRKICYGRLWKVPQLCGYC